MTTLWSLSCLSRKTSCYHQFRRRVVSICSYILCSLSLSIGAYPLRLLAIPTGGVAVLFLIFYWWGNLLSLAVLLLFIDQVYCFSSGFSYFVGFNG